MVHPSVPAIILCPICPHSLSFRPVIVPAGVEIKVGIILMISRKKGEVSVAHPSVPVIVDKLFV